jgi:hypothetical protein
MCAQPTNVASESATGTSHIRIGKTYFTTSSPTQL